jgi:uncharacterized repeat protein (TIGR03847 family)
VTGSYDFRQVGRFTVGTIGEPGQRVFYLQTFAEGTEVAVKCEKQQAQALAEHLLRLVAELPQGDPGPQPPADALPPSELLWAVGSISLGIDVDAGAVVVVLEEFVDPGEGADPMREPAELRVRLSAEQTRALVAQVDALVASSRPLCRLCEQPIDPTGHACPRLN